MRSKSKSGFVEGLRILEIKFGTFRVSESALTCDARDADLEALPLSLVGLLTLLRVEEADIDVGPSVAIVALVLEMRFADCSSLEPKVDLDVELWGE